MQEINEEDYINPHKLNPGSGWKPDFVFIKNVGVSLVHVVRASSAAPTFFPGSNSFEKSSLSNI